MSQGGGNYAKGGGDYAKEGGGKQWLPAGQGPSWIPQDIAVRIAPFVAPYLERVGLSFADIRMVQL